MVKNIRGTSSSIKQPTLIYHPPPISRGWSLNKGLTAVTKSGTGTWGLGREDLGTPGRGARGYQDVEVGDAGTWDS